MKLSFAICLTMSIALSTQVAAEQPSPLQLVQTIPLEHVKGRIDHLAMDLKNQRLFIAALGNDTIEVVDVRAGKHTRTLRGFHEPQGVIFLPDLNELIVTNGADGTCQFLDGDSLKMMQRIPFSGDADAIRYDDQAKVLYVGYGNGALGVIDAITGRRIADAVLTGHPESFQLESSGSRGFVNIPGADHIAVVDRHQRRVVTTWPTRTAHANFPMALDESRHRLFVGFRRPARLMVFDTESGTVVATLDCVGDADDIFYDQQHQRLYVSGGEGFLQVFAQLDVDKYQLLTKIPTAPGARTSLFVPELNRMFLAVPHRGNQNAQIRIYEVRL